MDPLAQQTQSPVQPVNTPVGHKKVGPIIAILVVVLILIIGALYLFASRLNQEQTPGDTSDIANRTDTSATTEPQVVQPVTNKSDDVNSLEADLNASTAGLDSQNF
jgi:cytoskeletal protein RodZ